MKKVIEIPKAPYLEVFENEQPLHLNSAHYPGELSTLDLESFPEITDFQMELFPAKSPTDQYLRFISPSQGVLASFPWWDKTNQALLLQPGSTLFGSITEPFNDADQGWQILIWESQDYIYIMEGEEPNCLDFPVWFCVSRTRFINQWHQLKDALQENHLSPS